VLLGVGFTLVAEWTGEPSKIFEPDGD
jgi:hypothetical protein